MRTFGVLGFFASFILSSMVWAQPELKGNPEELKGFLYPPEKMVTISGQAEETAYSDKAIISLVVTTENKLLSDAIAKNSELRKLLSDTLISAGIKADAIQSSKFSSSPQYGWFDKKPSSFKVVNRIAVSITQAEQLEEVAKVADEYSEVQFSSTAFEHTKKNEFDDKVKAKALARVLKQKAFYEKTLGLTLIPVGIRDSYINQEATRGAVLLEGAVAQRSLSKEVRRLDSDAFVAKNRRTNASFDELKYVAHVTVDFIISPKK